MSTHKTLQITFKTADAMEALKTAIPAMASGFNINTTQGDISLNDGDATAVMALVIELAQRRIAGAEPAPAIAGATTYNHAFTVAFEVAGSTSEDGEKVSAEQMRDAIRIRVNTLMSNNEMVEAVGLPYDTYCEA